MGASEKAEKLAIHCPDGKRPPDWPAKANRQIERLVIGAWEQSPGYQEGYKTQPVDADLLRDWKTLFPGLKAVHLWNLTGVTQLPELPAGLHTLEVRNCPDLTALPMLPASLEVLDVSGCGRLKKLTPKSTTDVPALKQLFLEDVGGLSDLEIGSFIKRLLEDDSNQLVELRVTNHPRLTDSLVQSLVEDPRPNPVSQSLIKLVLKGNTSLKQVGDLSRFEKLRHLDLSNCTNLVQIANLPDNLQYFAVWGPKSLSFGPTGTKTQQAQQVPEYDLGTKEQPNVAGRFKTRKKFGGDLSLGAHAKILFLGNGRVGKTTLANTLRRHFSRADADLSGLPRVEQIASTHGVELGRWMSHVVVPPARRDGLAAMSHHHPDWARKWSKSSPDRLQADLQLWDFGGQEIYHQTHRAFAGVGTVYVLVWRPKLTLQELEEDYDAEEQKKGGDWDCLKSEWLDQNRQHPVRYWVEYLTTLKDLRLKVEGDRQMFRDVVIVCPQTSASEGRPLLEQELEGDQLLSKIDRNQCFYFNSCDPAAAQNSEYQRFVECLRERAGEVASEQSLLQPKVYEKAVEYVESELDSIHRNRRETGDEAPERCLRTVDVWQQQIIAELQPHADKPLEREDVESITSYLDACGKVLTLRGSLKLADRGERDSTQATQRHIVVDINWILENVYSLLSRSASSGSLYQKIKKNQGRVPIEMLRSHSTVRGIDETGARPLLDFMEQCGILVPLSTRAGAREYLATERSLLPPWSEMAGKCDAEVESLQTAGPVGGWEISFPRSRLCEFDVRPILGRLGRMFGENAVFFQDGMQAQGTGKDLHDDRFEPVCSAEGRNSQWLKNDAEALATEWVLRVLWETQDAESMLGGVLAGIQVAGPKAQEVRDALVEILNKRLEVGVANVQMRQPPYAFLPPAAMRKPGSENPAFVYSVFVSFATVDNGSGWVDSFCETLKTNLNEQLGTRDPNRVWFDKERVEKHFPLAAQIEKRVRESRMLLVFLSPGYSQSAWCGQERKVFLEKNRTAVDEGRVVLVDLGRLGLEGRPREFQGLGVYNFFKPSSNNRELGTQFATPVPNVNFEKHQPFFDAVRELSVHVAATLKKLG
jgi:GTPase SAR1 family protein